MSKRKGNEKQTNYFREETTRFPSTNVPSFTVISLPMVLVGAARLNAVFENHSIFHYSILGLSYFLKFSFLQHASFNL